MGQKERDGELQGRQRRRSGKETEIRWDKVGEHREKPQGLRHPAVHTLAPCCLQPSAADGGCQSDQRGDGRWRQPRDDT